MSCFLTRNDVRVNLHACMFLVVLRSFKKGEAVCVYMSVCVCVCVQKFEKKCHGCYWKWLYALQMYKDCVCACVRVTSNALLIKK